MKNLHLQQRVQFSGSLFQIEEKNAASPRLVLVLDADQNQNLREVCPVLTVDQHISTRLSQKHGDDQISVEYEEPASAAKSRDAKSPGRNFFLLLLLSFGFLCILQSALNVSLRLTSYCSQNLTGHHTEDSGTVCPTVCPTREPDQNPTSQPAGETPEALTAQIQQMKRLLCVYGSEDGDLDVNLTALPRSFKQQLATFCPSIYYISSAVATWDVSRNDCLKRGADLVIINSRDEQDFLTWYKKRLWIGLTDAEKEGEWKWVDGTRLNTSYWGPHEPNSNLGTNEDCGEMRFSESENNWNDVPCGIKNSWICERKLQG